MMHSTTTIRRMAQEAGERHTRSGEPRPLKKWPGEEMTTIPFLGTACERVDKKHERIETLFVDSSGFGSPGELALTIGQFLERISELHEEHGGLLLAIEEQGQFQVYVAVWKEKGKDDAGTDPK